jgi:hypothetical protein
MASVTDYSWTHLRSDPCHSEDDLRIATGTGRYQLGSPANGTQGVFVPEPTTRIQKWGAAQLVNQQKTDVESDLFNINRTTTKSPCGSYNPNTNKFNGIQPTPMPESSFPQNFNRLGDPPCTLRGTGWNRFEWLCQNPQENVMIPFDWFVPGRILSKDSHRPCIPKPSNPSPSLPTPLNNWSDSFYSKSDNLVAREQVKEVLPVTQNQWSSPESRVECPAPVGPPSVTWNRTDKSKL